MVSHLTLDQAPQPDDARSNDDDPLAHLSGCPSKRIQFVEQERCLRIHEGRAGDDRRDFAGSTVKPVKPSPERAADDAFLDPRVAFSQFSIGSETGKFRARAGAAGRAVVGFARTLHKISRVSA